MGAGRLQGRGLRVRVRHQRLPGGSGAHEEQEQHMKMVFTAM